MAVSVARNSKDTVLNAAVAMFSERGFEGTSMRELGAKLHVTARALYRHYPDKSALFVAAVAPLLDGVDGLLVTPPDATFAARLDWTTRYAELLRRNPDVTRLVGAEIAWSRHEEVGPRARKQDAAVREILCASGDVQRAAQALGMLWWPIVCLRKTGSESVADLAARALATATGPPKDSGRS